MLAAQGSQLTNKYAEGYPGKRYYGGCEFVDVAEQLAIDRAKKLFHAEAANVQPHSGAQANQAVFFAALKPGDTILGMSLPHGGHLTHGSPVNMSRQVVQRRRLRPRPETELIDYDAAERLAHEHKPKLIIAGASAYSRVIDWKRFRAIADAVGALLMVDMAHYAGLIAAGVYPSPVGIADFVTSTTHKTLRGPRGGFILDAARAREGDQLGGVPGPAGRAADARDRREGRRVRRGAAARTSRVYQEQVLENARVLAHGAAGARPAHRVRRHRLAHVPGRPARQEDHRQGRRGGARRARTSPSTRTRFRTIRKSRSSPRASASAVRRSRRAASPRSNARSSAHLIADVLDAPADDAVIDARARRASRALTRKFPGLPADAAAPA